MRLSWKRSAILHRPPEELFEGALQRLINIDRVPGATGMDVSEGPIGAGTTVQWSVPHKGIVISDSLTITEFEPGRKISTRSIRRYQHAPGSTSSQRYANVENATTTLFEPVPGGTRMEVSVQLWYSGVNARWYPVMLLANGSTYRKQHHKIMDDMLDRIEGPSVGRKALSLVRQIWSGWIVFALVLLALLWVHAAHDELGIIGPMLQLVRAAISFMLAGALLAAYFMASTRTAR